MYPSSPKRILFIRPSALGDVCRSVPVVVSLKKQWPEATIDWLVQSEFVDAVSAHPAIETIIPFPRKAMKHWYLPAGFFKLMSLLRLLKKKKYDLVIDAQGLARSGLFTWTTRCATRVGLASAKEYAWLAYTHKVVVQHKHTVDQMLELSEAAGANSIVDMQLYVNQPDATWWDAWKETNDIEQYAVLAPTSRWQSKQWPQERFLSVAEHIMNLGMKVIIVGAPHEENQITSLLEHEAVHNVLPEMTIGRMMAVIASSQFVLANDSAALHIAVGFNRTCVGLFGPTNPAIVGPYKKEDSVIAADVHYEHVQYRNRSLGTSIMEQIETQTVICRIDEILEMGKDS